MRGRRWWRLRFFLTLRAVPQVVRPFLASKEGWIFLKEKSTLQQWLPDTGTAEPLKRVSGACAPSKLASSVAKVEGPEFFICGGTSGVRMRHPGE